MKKRAIDIFSGAGGLSLGAEWAGIEVSTAIEANKSAADTYRLNSPHTEVICEDINKINPERFIDKDNPVFLIMGGPPCQGFSMSNTKSRTMTNPKNQLFRAFVRFVDIIRPKWFLFENVGGFANLNKGLSARWIKSCFEEVGYTVEPSILWADEFGVPQRRNRFFMVGSLDKIHFTFPEPDKKKKVTVADAIEDLPILSNGDMIDELPYTKSFGCASEYAKLMRKNSKVSRQNFVSHNNDLVIERYKHIGQGQNWRAIPDYLMDNYADKGRCHSGIYKRLRADSPSVVISNYRKSMLIHPYQDRGISVREAARIQSFPDDFIFEGPISHIQQQIGNAVPPLLAKAIFEKILKY